MKYQHLTTDVSDSGIEVIKVDEATGKMISLFIKMEYILEMADDIPDEEWDVIVDVKV